MSNRILRSLAIMAFISCGIHGLLVIVSAVSGAYGHAIGNTLFAVGLFFIAKALWRKSVVQRQEASLPKTEFQRLPDDVIQLALDKGHLTEEEFTQVAEIVKKEELRLEE